MSRNGDCERQLLTEWRQCGEADERGKELSRDQVLSKVLKSKCVGSGTGMEGGGSYKVKGSQKGRYFFLLGTLDGLVSLTVLTYLGH